MITLKDGVYWVGAVDWDLRNFHGYTTPRGSSYNSYLIVADKIALVDTVKAHLYDDLMRHIKEIIDPAKIDYIISNHAEPDHSGNLARIAQKAPNAKIIATERGKRIIQKYYGDMDITTTKEMPKVDLGGKTLNFTPIPMAHWPDSMVTYILEDKILLSNDAFGQHLASTGRFDDTVRRDELIHEARAYYANILMPLGGSVKRAMSALAGIEIDVIAPSHGIIWRKDLDLILDLYSKWVELKSEHKAVIVYDSMWRSTEIMAKILSEGLDAGGVEVKLFNLTLSQRSDVITEVLEAKAVLVGSPTLNNHVFPTVAAFLAYLRGLRPKGKLGVAFGSHGWAGGAKKFIEEQLQLGGLELVENELVCTFKPSDDEINMLYEFGKGLADKIKES